MTMRKILILIFTLFTTLFLTAQDQDNLGMNYQAIARNAEGQLLANQAIRLRAAFLVGGPQGKAVYQEEHQVTTSENGLFTLVIGSGSHLSGQFNDIPWSEKNIWLEMAIAEGDNRAFTLLGASQLLAVPYAFHAGSAETIHVHSPADKSGCRITGLPFWSILGNDNVNDECHFIGTVIPEDLIFKVDGVERMRIPVGGPILMDSIRVTGTGTFFNLEVENDLTVGRDAAIGRDLAVEGRLDARGRVVVDGGADGSQSEQDSYPLLVKGSRQGIAIEVNPAAGSDLESGRGNNYMSFWKNGEMTGRIEGMNKADLDPTGLVNLIQAVVSTAPQGVNFAQSIPDVENLLQPQLTTIDIAGVSVPVVTGVGITLPDAGLPSNLFGNAGSNFVTTYIQNPSGLAGNTPASAIWGLVSGLLCAPNGVFVQSTGPEAATNWKSQIFSNYTLDILTNSIATFGSIVELAASAASVLDPEDIVNEAIDLAVDITNLVIIGSYADINLGVAYESGAGDYAEWLPRAFPEEQLTYGDVVGVIGGKVSQKFTHADRFMVVSAAPILLGNMPGDAPGEAASEKIAFMGQVPVKVQGKVEIGDYLLPSGKGDGLAIAAAPHKMKARDYQRIIGVAWEASEGGEVFQMIRTAVGLNHNDTGHLIEELQMVVNQMQKALQEVNPDYQPSYFQVDETAVARQCPGYSVSPTHPSRISSYFSEKSYDDRTEMLQDVKLTLQEEAGIDLNKYPVIAYILDHPEQATNLQNYYSSCQSALRLLLEAKD